MSIVITGATGNLGGLVVDALIRRGVDPGAIVAAGRNTDRLAELATRGVGTARIDLDDPTSIRAAFSGAEKVLLVSVPGSPRRVVQHQNAIDAALAAKVELLAYTSWMRADSSTMLVAEDHRATERLLDEAGVPHVVLRFAAFFESRTGLIPIWRARGEVVGAAADGRVSAASRVDLADAAAAVLATGGSPRAAVELASARPFTMAEFAEELGRQLGKAIPYIDVTEDELRATLVDAGFNDRLAKAFVDHDRAIAAGEAVVDTRELRDLIGRPPIELPAAVAQAIPACRVG